MPTRMACLWTLPRLASGSEAAVLFVVFDIWRYRYEQVIGGFYKHLACIWRVRSHALQLRASETTHEAMPGQRSRCSRAARLMYSIMIGERSQQDVLVLSCGHIILAAQIMTSSVPLRQARCCPSPSRRGPRPWPAPGAYI